MMFFVKLVSILIIIFLLQVTLIEKSAAFDFDLLFLFFGFIAMFENISKSLSAAVLSGFLYDLISPYVFGFYIFSFVIIVFFVRVAEYKVYKNSLSKQAVIFALSFIVFKLILAFLISVFGNTSLNTVIFSKSFLHRFILTVFLYPVFFVIFNKFFKYERQT